MGEEQWYYGVAGRRAGPVTFAALQDRVREGLLQPGDPVWREGSASWVPGGTVEGLFPTVSPPDAFRPVAPPVTRLRTASGKDRITAGLFAILLGSFGAHKFYMNKIGLGIVYLLFCWTLIPGIAGIVEGILYLAMPDEEFAAKYR